MLPFLSKARCVSSFVRARYFAFLVFGLLAITTLQTACDPEDVEPSPDTATKQGNLRTSAWRSGPEVPFLGIASLEIGGPSQRSVIGSARIEVLYDSTNTIRIESRALVVHEEAKAAQALLPQVGYRAQNPQNATRNCEDTAWAEGCRIDGYFRGETADGRPPSGAIVDLRVHVPRGWPGKLKIWTQDNLSFADQFPFRADVSVRDFVGQLEISAESGEVQLRRDASAHAALNCNAEQVLLCEEVRWNPDSLCACSVFSAVQVRMRGAGNVMLNLQRQDIFGQVSKLANVDPKLSSASPLQCNARIECEGFDWCAERRVRPWEILGAELNNNDILNERAGIGIDLQSAHCREIRVARDEEDFGRPLQQLRGNLKLCADENGLCGGRDRSTIEPVSAPKSGFEP